jgi:hypothetical protein
MVLAPLAPDGTVTLFNASAGMVRITADVSGWIRGPQAPPGARSISNGASPSERVSMSDDGRYVTFGGYIWDSQTRATTPFRSKTRTFPDCDYDGTPLHEGYGLVSGDGQHVLSDLSGRCCQTQIDVWNRSNGTSKLVTSSYVSSLSISNDGSNVVYTPISGAPEFDFGPYEVMRWSRTTGEGEAIVSLPPVDFPNTQERTFPFSRISGDGRTIYYELGHNPFTRPGPREIFRWRDGQSEKITEGVVHDISDDGNVVLFTRTDGEAKYLSLWSNGTSTDLAADQPNLARLSGDGRVAVWQQQESADHEGPMTVYRNETGKDAVKILSYPSGSRATDFALSRDGSRLAYVERDDTSEPVLGSLGVFLR